MPAGVTAVRALSPHALIDRCYRRLRAANDGGDSSMDKGGVAGITVVPAGPAPGGHAPANCARAVAEPFARWHRPGTSFADLPGDRGEAIWVCPDAARVDRGGDVHRRPRVLFLHGGSYTWYAPRTPAVLKLTGTLAVAMGTAVLSIDYRKAPEHRVSDATEDAIRAIEWLSRPENCCPCLVRGDADLGAGAGEAAAPTADEPPVPVYVVGDSAGGGLALLATLEAPADARAVVLGLGLFSPYTDLSATLPSYRTRAWDPARSCGDPVFSNGNTAERIQACRDGAAKQGRGLVADGMSLDDPRCSPVFSERLASLPPTRIHVGDAEVMLDESVEVAARANGSAAGAGADAAPTGGGGPVSVHVWERMWHDFVYYAEACVDEAETDLPLIEATAALYDVAAHYAECCVREHRARSHPLAPGSGPGDEGGHYPG